MHEEIRSILDDMSCDLSLPQAARNAAAWQRSSVTHGYVNHKAIADIVFRYKPSLLEGLLHGADAPKLIDGVVGAAAESFFDGRCDSCIYSTTCKMRCYRNWRRCRICLSDCMEQCKRGMARYLQMTCLHIPVPASDLTEGPLLT